MYENQNWQRLFFVLVFRLHLHLAMHCEYRCTQKLSTFHLVCRNCFSLSVLCARGSIQFRCSLTVLSAVCDCHIVFFVLSGQIKIDYRLIIKRIRTLWGRTISASRLATPTSIAMVATASSSTLNSVNFVPTNRDDNPRQFNMHYNSEWNKKQSTLQMSR